LNPTELPPSLQTLVERLAHLPNVVAVALGGSHARGDARQDSDWDFALYYRGTFAANTLRELGYTGHIVEPGTWGRLVNGGGWLTIDGQHVDVLYRDLNAIERWVIDAQQGRFEVDNVAGHIVGLPTYVPMGELAIGKVLIGELPHPSFPDALRWTAPPWWNGNAAFSLLHADSYAVRGEIAGCTGSLARAVMAVAHARLAEQGRWVLNEKRMVQWAGLADAEKLLAYVGETPEALQQTVEQMRKLLGLARPQSMQADEVVKPD
jgi:hypothetical protein